jgi:hypothetical protein
MASRSASIVAAGGERSGRPVLQIGDAGERRLQTLALRLILGNGDRQRPFGALDAGRRVPDVLVKDQERTAIEHLLLGGVGGAA